MIFCTMLLTFCILETVSIKMRKLSIMVCILSPTFIAADARSRADLNADDGSTAFLTLEQSIYRSYAIPAVLLKRIRLNVCQT